MHMGAGPTDAAAYQGGGCCAAAYQGAVLQLTWVEGAVLVVDCLEPQGQPVLQQDNGHLRVPH